VGLLLFSECIELGFLSHSAQQCALLPAELTHRGTACCAACFAQDGLPFGHLALRQVGASVVANRSDIKLLAFWWTNSVHLRGFLQSLNLALEDGHADTPTSLHWASEVSARLAWVRAHALAFNDEELVY
jgi:hypothetical protein